MPFSPNASSSSCMLIHSSEFTLELPLPHLIKVKQILYIHYYYHTHICTNIYHSLTWEKKSLDLLLKFSNLSADVRFPIHFTSAQICSINQKSVIFNIWIFQSSGGHDIYILNELHMFELCVFSSSGLSTGFLSLSLLTLRVVVSIRVVFEPSAVDSHFRLHGDYTANHNIIIIIWCGFHWLPSSKPYAYGKGRGMKWAKEFK